MTDAILEAARDFVFPPGEVESLWGGAWRDVAYGDFDEDVFEFTADERDPDTGRWTQHCYAVFQHKESGRYFGFDWQSGLTESQEDEGPHSRDEVKECFRHETTQVVVEWKDTPSDS